MSEKQKCPMDVFIKELAAELDTTLEIARHIYDTMTVVTVRVLEDYDSVKPIAFVDVERQQTEEKSRYNPQTGEVDVVEPKDKLKASVPRHFKEYDKTQVFVERREEKIEKQKIRENQIQQERQEYEHQRKMATIRKRKKSKARMRRERKRQKMILDFLAEDKKQYNRDSSRRFKGRG